MYVVYVVCSENFVERSMNFTVLTIILRIGTVIFTTK